MRDLVKLWSSSVSRASLTVGSKVEGPKRMMKIKGGLWLLCLLAVEIRARPESAELLAASSTEYRTTQKDYRTASSGRTGSDQLAGYRSAASSGEHKPHELYSSSEHQHDASSETRVASAYSDHLSPASAEPLVSEQRTVDNGSESRELLDKDAHLDDSRMFNPAELFNFPSGPLISPAPGPQGIVTTGAIVNKCSGEGDMFYETRGDGCWVCGCFTGFSGMYPKCAPCTCSSGLGPYPIPVPSPIPGAIEPIPGQQFTDKKNGQIEGPPPFYEVDEYSLGPSFSGIPSSSFSPNIISPPYLAPEGMPVLPPANLEYEELPQSGAYPPELIPDISGTPDLNYPSGGQKPSASEGPVPLSPPQFQPDWSPAQPPHLPNWISPQQQYQPEWEPFQPAQPEWGPLQPAQPDNIFPEFSPVPEPAYVPSSDVSPNSLPGLVPLPVPVPDPVPIPLPPLVPEPVPVPQPQPLPPLPPAPYTPPYCPPPVYIPGPPRPYPVPVPVPGKPVVVRIPVPVPLPPEKIYIRGPSVPVPIQVTKNVPVPYPVNRPVPVPVPSPPIRIPVNRYITIPGKDRLVIVPVPVSDNKYYQVPVIIYVNPECRWHHPLVPFRSPSEPCKIFVCKIKYNYVYLESTPDSSCLAPVPSGSWSNAAANAGASSYGQASAAANAAANAGSSAFPISPSYQFGSYGPSGYTPYPSGESSAQADASATAENGGSYPGIDWANANAAANAGVDWSNANVNANAANGGYKDGYSSADASANAYTGYGGGFSGTDAAANAANLGAYSGFGGGFSSADAAAYTGGYGGYGFGGFSSADAAANAHEYGGYGSGGYSSAEAAANADGYGGYRPGGFPSADAAANAGGYGGYGSGVFSSADAAANSGGYGGYGSGGYKSADASANAAGYSNYRSDGFSKADAAANAGGYSSYGKDSFSSADANDAANVGNYDGYGGGYSSADASASANNIGNYGGFAPGGLLSADVASSASNLGFGGYLGGHSSADAAANAASLGNYEGYGGYSNAAANAVAAANKYGYGNTYGFLRSGGEDAEGRGADKESRSDDSADSRRKRNALHRMKA